MLLEKDHFDDWMHRVMQKLESIEKACTAREETVPLPSGERLLDNEDLCRMLNVSKRSLQRAICLIRCSIIKPFTKNRT